MDLNLEPEVVGAMARMSDEECRDFLGAEPRPVVLATTRADGRPHAAPVWIALDGDGADTTIVFTTGAETVKGRTLRRDPRVCLVADDDRPPFSLVLIDGVASVESGAAELLHWATVIGGRYMGADKAAEYGERNGVPGELLVRVRPTRWAGVSNLAD